MESDDDIIIMVSNGSIKLFDAGDKPIHIIIGESGTSGGSTCGKIGGNSRGIFSGLKNSSSATNENKSETVTPYKTRQTK